MGGLKGGLNSKRWFTSPETGKLDELGYGAHYYGPCSSKVTATVEELRGLGFSNKELPVAEQSIGKALR